MTPSAAARGARSLLLPYLEQTALWNGMQNGSVSPPSQPPKMFVDPSDATTPFTSSTASYMPGAAVAYTASPYSYNAGGVWSESSGSQTFVGGPYASSSSSSTGKKRTFTSVFSDGTSNTMLISEQVSGCASYGTSSWYQVTGPYQYDYGGGNYYGIVGFKSGAAYKTCGPYLQSYLMTTRAGPIQIALADGSVRGVRDSISVATTRNLLDPSDGNVLGNDF